MWGVGSASQHILYRAVSVVVSAALCLDLFLTAALGKQVVLSIALRAIQNIAVVQAALLHRCLVVVWVFVLQAAVWHIAACAAASVIPSCLPLTAVN